METTFGGRRESQTKNAETPHSPLHTPLHAARHTERSSDGRKDTDGNLQDSFPSVLVHDFLDLIVSTYLSLEFRVKNVELSA